MKKQVADCQSNVYLYKGVRKGYIDPDEKFTILLEYLLNLISIEWKRVESRISSF